ncbi:MAG TPA: energy transducer TonB [Verrucomicrobiae bacterium]|nr:energy transducer TonB [Verrucomicrobiae bacterium]
MSHKAAMALFIALSTTGAMAFAPCALAQASQNDEILRRAKSKVQPDYPELARKMKITGAARIEVVVAPNGTVREARIVGGHPVLAGAALEAARKWKFEPAAEESKGLIEFKFEPH